MARGPALDLSRASVGTLRLGGRRPAGFAAAGGFRLDGLSYSGLPVLGDLELITPRPQPDRRPSRWRRRPGRAGDPVPHQEAVTQWLSWFRHETAEHADQPYAALAAAYQAAGRNDLARAILVAQREDARIRAAMGPRRRLGQQAARWLTGYGYRSWYALLWLAGLVAVTVGLAVFWFGPARYIQPTAAARAGRPGGQFAPCGQSVPGGQRVAGGSRVAVREPVAVHEPVAVRQPSTVCDCVPAGQPVPGAASRRRARPRWSADTQSPGRAPRTGTATVPRSAECGVAGRVGYAVGLVLPFAGRRRPGRVPYRPRPPRPPYWRSAGWSGCWLSPCSWSTRSA